MKALTDLLTQKWFQLFVLIFIHNTCLDLAIVTGNGLVFYTEHSLEFNTIITHLWIASVVSLVYVILQKWRTREVTSTQKNELTLAVSSLMLLLSFGWLNFSWL